MKRLSKKKRFLILLAPVVLWILTLGIHIELGVNSECQQPSGYTLEDFNNGTASISIYGVVDEDGCVTYGIKYLFYISSDELPSRLRLAFDSAKAAKGDVVSITDLRITHASKESHILVQPDGPIEACFDTYDNGKYSGDKPHYSAYVHIPKAVKHRSSFEVHIKGDIYHKEGPEHFEQTLKIEYSRAVEIVPGWFFVLWHIIG